MKLHRYIAGLFGYELIKTRKLNDTLPQHLRNVIAEQRINVVVDVGANRGQFGRALRLHGYAGRIASFEPNSEAFEELKSLTDLDPAWFSFALGLGAENTLHDLNVSEASEFSSLLETNDYARDRFGWRTQPRSVETVQVQTLSSVWPDVCYHLVQPRALLKLDTQGYDREVLAGCDGAVLKNVHALQIEVSMKSIYKGAPRYIEVLDELERLGFEITGMYPVSRDKRSLAIVEYDCVMTRGHAGAGVAGTQGQDLQKIG